MEAKIRAKAEMIFKNQKAIEYYNQLVSDTHVYEFGVDTNNNIYFAFLNGNIERYSRNKFLKLAKLN